MSPKDSPYMSLHHSTSTLDLGSHQYTKSHSHDEDHDLEDASSETTLSNEGLLSKRSNLASKSERLATILTWVRFGTIILLQGIIIMMLLPSAGLMDAGWGMVLKGKPGAAGGGVAIQAGNVPIDKTKGGPWTAGKTETGGDINGLYIPTGHTYTLLTIEEEKFFPNMSGDINRMEIRHNWDTLMPLGSGSVQIPDHKNYPNIGEPITDDPIRSGPIFEASWTHALHYNYHQMVSSSSLPNFTSAADLKYGFGKPRNDMHAAHCFEYLRNQILCSADMTLEGQKSAIDATGNGQAHMCRDRGEAVRWIEERRVDDLQDIVGP